MRRTYATLMAGLIAGTALTAPAMAEELTIGLKSEATSMDPQFHNLATNTQVLSNIFEGLTEQDPVQKVEPSLATEWTAVDDTTWRFTLREGVKFHNGSDFTARDVIYTYCRVPLVENSPSSYTIFTGTMADVTAEDDYTVIIKTEGPNPLLPTEISNLPIVSADAGGAEETITFGTDGCEGMGTVPQAGDFNSPDVAVGTGPYKLQEFTRGNQLVLSRFEDYWGEKPDWETVMMRPISSNGPRVAALLAGDVMMIESPPIQDIPRIEQGGYKIIDALSNRIIYLHMRQDTADAPSISGTDGKNPLQDVNVRKAISLAINREAIKERIMGGFAVPAGELLPPPMFGTSGREADPYDPEQAKALLADAGYPDGFEITLGTPNDRYINDEQVAQAIAQMLTRIGIKTNVDASTASQFFSRRNALDFPIYMAGWGASSGEMSSPLKSLVTTFDKEAGRGVTNAGRYSNAEMDAVLEEAMTTIDDAKRDALLQKAETMVLDDYGIIPIHYEQTVWALDPSLDYEPRVDQYTIAFQVKKAAD
ncbi:ABC transporter substrate-binding protein [Acuticoccus sp. M5D2P5]|uniref:ABC transporter substrate-binding protein n=1 Tax=Acuticoccus kalidii TaxID=2910977 RepID=UPI001F48F625|nr:ABC transporter substrate-binding protein [Acuticoccus kalidii]MCF3936613.1 ABC transporter substrate-binding protein [Acuticoccus kalidii]